MRDCKTIKISELLQEFNEEKRKEIIDTFDSCLKSIYCEAVKWQEFEVFLPSCAIARGMLEELVPEFIMVICDVLNQQDRKENNVKITFQRNKNEPGVYTVNQNYNTTLAVIYY